MKVKVGNKVYDSENEPVMIILSKGEKKQIANMRLEATKYCVYPDTDKLIRNDYSEIKAWMKDI